MSHSQHLQRQLEWHYNNGVALDIGLWWADFP